MGNKSVGCRSFTGASLLAGLGLATGAHAQPLPEPAYSEVHLILEPGAYNAENRTAKIGDVMVRGQLAYADAAVVDDAIVTYDKLIFKIDASTPLVSARLRRNDQRWSEGGRVFCTEQLEVPRAVKNEKHATFKGDRFTASVRLCLADSEADGSFDRYFIQGARWSPDQPSMELTPLPYRRQPFTALQGLGWQMSFKNGDRQGFVPILGALVKRDIVEVTSNFVMNHYYPVITSFPDEPCGQGKLHLDHGVKYSKLPQTISVGCGSVAIDSYDDAFGQLAYRLVNMPESLRVRLTVTLPVMNGYVIHTFE